MIPTAIDRLIHEFDSKESSFNELDVQQALNVARASLVDPTEGENFGAWAEVLAFSLVANRAGEGPWGTYFVPMGSGTDSNGKALYFPDIADADNQVITHWINRTNTVKHPVLKARYADLSWEMCRVIARIRRDPEMARLAIDSYLASIEASFRPDLYDRFTSAVRAFDLATLIQDKGKTECARKILLGLHQEAVCVKQGLWWIAFDRLVLTNNTGITDGEKREIIDSFEGLILYFGDTSNPKNFNPHALQNAAKKLIRHYTRLQQHSDIQRLNGVIARAFEHFASLGDAILASSVLQTSVNAYKAAGMPEDSERVRMLMQEKIRQAAYQRVPIGAETEIPRADIEAFLASIVVEDLGCTFFRIAMEFLPRKDHIEKQIKETAENAPLMSLVSIDLIAGDHVAARVGSVKDDPLGRLIYQTKTDLEFSRPFLNLTLRRTIKLHKAEPEHFVGWANRLALFDDMSLLLEGVEAWYDGDLTKALHVLVPQIELGLRGIMAQSGKAITKAHSTVADTSVAIGMGDILYSESLKKILGIDLTFYFLAIYADPRGMNLRNRLAHGLIKPDQIGEHLAQLLIHTLLVFGIWKELVDR